LTAPPDDFSKIREACADVRQLISGANKHFTPSELLRVGGATITVTELTEIMQRFVDNKDAIATQRAALAARIQAERVAAPSQLAVIRAFETVVRGAFGDAADALADFGLTPPKPRSPMTAEATAVAVAKRAATREARHTMGKNQRLPLRRGTSGIRRRFALRAASAASP
jgi:hypothetical protein